ncbi:hypothetical protein Slin15195_G110330 [Septoria linicola]|uniref:Nephrocystin 3-like N-terminal domain-containing protein n=1 Tax=Septoria linicola TaxID=215465 RepID=A0A9Q9AYX1_9PEZI|nr:hypothetical protein Slin15195_G110330 [Septoria linicola]
MPSTPSARAFMVGRAGRLHPALDASNSRYDARRDEFVAINENDTGIRRDAAWHTARFIDIMNIVAENAASKPGVQTFDLRKAHDWVEVRREAALTSQDKYNDKIKGFRGFFPRIARKIGDMNPAIEPIATTLPAGEYTSLVCGGIVLMFKAFDRVTKVREQVLTTLGEYPELLDSVERLLQLYRDDVKLEQRATALYIALLITIEGMIMWFEEKTWKRLKAFMEQGLYAKDLEDKINHLKQCGRALKDSADLCDKERTNEAFLVIQDIYERLKDTNRGIEEVVDEVRRTGNENYAAIGDVQAQVIRIVGQNNVAIKHLEKLNEDQGIKVKNLVMEHISAFDCAWEKRAEDRAEARAEARARGVRAEADALRMRTELLEKELELARRFTVLSQQYAQELLGEQVQDPLKVASAYTKYSRIEGSQADITNILLQHEKFRRWYTLDTSEPLLIIPPPSSAKTSPASFAAAALFDAFRDFKSATTIGYFSDKEHFESTDQPTVKMLKSLIQQLLHVHQYDLTYWTTVTSLNDHHDYLFYGDVDYLCSFFKYLVRRAPGGAVFCIIDNIQHLERNAPTAEVDMIMRMFRDLLNNPQDQQLGAEDTIAFKPMLLSPQSRGRVVSSMYPDEVLRIVQTESRDDLVTSWKLMRRLRLNENVFGDESETAQTGVEYHESS